MNERSEINCFGDCESVETNLKISMHRSVYGTYIKRFSNPLNFVFQFELEKNLRHKFIMTDDIVCCKNNDKK